MRRRHFDDGAFFCDRDCDGCILNDEHGTVRGHRSDDGRDDGRGDEDFSPEEDLVDRLVRIKDQWMDTDFKPCHGPFDYLDDDPGDEELAMEIGHLTFIGSFTALMVLKAENAIFRVLEDYYLDNSALATAISFLTDIDEATVAGVLTASDIIFHLIDIRMEEAETARNSRKKQ